MNNYKTKAMFSSQAIVEYIEENYSRSDLALSEMLEVFDVGRTVLCRKFKMDIGMTIGAFIKQVRMEKAKELLERKNQSVYFISSQCGFESSGYFSKCFKAYYGISPMNYMMLK